MRTLIRASAFRGAIFLVAFFAAGCTELKVLPAPPGPVQGLAYFLPKRTLAISVAYELRECSVAGNQLRISVAKAATVAPTLVPDETERYYIPYDVLRNWWKDMNITVESQEWGTLKGVTTIVTDRTADALSQAVTAAVKLSAFSLAPVRSQAKDQPPPVPVTCNGDRLKDIASLAKLRAIASPSEADKAEMARLVARLTHKETVNWTPRKPKPGTSVGNPFAANVVIEPAGLVPGAWASGDGLSLPPELRTDVQVVVLGPVTADPATRPEGFLVRQGLPSTIRVCDDRCPAPVAVTGQDALRFDESGLLLSTTAVLPQFGDYVGVPFRNRPFETQTITLTLGAEGGITKMGFQSNAMGVEALKSLNTNLDTLATAKAARDKAAADAAAAAQNARQAHANQVAADNTAIAQCLTAQDNVRKAGGAVSGSCQ